MGRILATRRVSGIRQALMVEDPFPPPSGGVQLQGKPEMAPKADRYSLRVGCKI